MKRSQKIKLIRNNLGLSIENISKRLGVSATQISRLETGKSEISDEILERYCKEFDTGKRCQAPLKKNKLSKIFINENRDI